MAIAVDHTQREKQQDAVYSSPTRNKTSCAPRYPCTDVPAYTWYDSDTRKYRVLVSPRTGTKHRYCLLPSCLASNPQPPVIRVPSVQSQINSRSLGSIPAAAAAAAAGCWSNLSRSAFAKRPSSAKPSPPSCGGTGGSRGSAPAPSLPSIVDRFGASIWVFAGFPCGGVLPGAVSIACQR